MCVCVDVLLCMDLGIGFVFICGCVFADELWYMWKYFVYGFAGVLCVYLWMHFLSNVLI